MTLRVVLPPGREPERRYAVEVVFEEFLGLDVVVEPGSAAAVTDGAVTLELADVFFATDDWLGPRSLPRTPLERRDGLPVLYGDDRGVDVLGSAFFCLTRYEEAVAPERDEHGRFPAAASIAAREDFVERPLVCEYVDLLWDELRRLWPRLERRRRSFRVLPSHDVDRLHTRAWPTAAGDLLVRRDPALALRRVVGEPADSFELLLRTSERRGLASAFYFIAGRSGSRDADYAIEEAAPLLRRLRERGHEVGLHPSYETWRDPERLRREADALRAAGAVDPIGGRQHWLRWEPATWDLWEDAGLAYDSSLGWPDRCGFRASCCWEYPVFSLAQRRRLGLRERPLLVMDSALGPVDRPARPGAAAAVLRVREACRRHDGDLTVLWHNEWAAYRHQRRLYETALDGG